MSTRVGSGQCESPGKLADAVAERDVGLIGAEQAKASGLVAWLIERHGVDGVNVAPRGR
jgi:hypothetical protein